MQIFSFFLNNCKLNIFRFWTKQVIWRLGLLGTCEGHFYMIRSDSVGLLLCLFITVWFRNNWLNQSFYTAVQVPFKSQVVQQYSFVLQVVLTIAASNCYSRRCGEKVADTVLFKLDIMQYIFRQFLREAFIVLHSTCKSTYRNNNFDYCGKNICKC